MSLVDRAYRSYELWKGDAGIADEAPARDMFARELRRAMGTRTGKVLEIGFGEGRFLDVAKEAGNEVWGLEIVETYVERAKARGHTALVGTLESAAGVLPHDFDAVFLFDVFEHMDIEEIDAMLSRLVGMTSSNGIVVGRFPNGASPFFGRNQYGDLTHKSILSALKMRQLAVLSGWRLAGAYDEIRSHVGARFWGLPSRARLALAKLIGFVVSNAFLGRSHPMAPNLVVHLKRAPYQAP
jgi:SAM-dependent methyltransferase